jgi:hypothetical protein
MAYGKPQEMRDSLFATFVPILAPIYGLATGNKLIINHLNFGTSIELT